MHAGTFTCIEPHGPVEKLYSPGPLMKQGEASDLLQATQEAGYELSLTLLTVKPVLFPCYLDCHVGVQSGQVVRDGHCTLSTWLALTILTVLCEIRK